MDWIGASGRPAAPPMFLPLPTTPPLLRKSLLKNAHTPQGGQWVPPWAAGRWDPAARGPFAPQLAVIIDLTNTSRYYRPDEVPPGVAYVKV